MKHKRLIIASLVFFLLINTTYFWEGQLGVLAFLTTLILILYFIGLAGILLNQLFLAIKEKLADKSRLIAIGTITIVLSLTFFFPHGLINFDKLSGPNLLVAQREGAANCMTTFKLKKNNKFTERNVCFGVTEINGNYKIINDTIFFENVNFGRNHDGFYEFALIRPSELDQHNNKFELLRYKNFTDTMGHKLSIIKNDLNK